MPNVFSEAQKRQVIEVIGKAREEWERAGRQKPDYESDREAFYAHVKKSLLPQFLQAGGKEDLFLSAVQQYAREDWIKSGYDPSEFDDRIKSAERRKTSFSREFLIRILLVTLLRYFFEWFFRIKIGFLWLFLFVEVLLFVVQRVWRNYKYKRRYGSESEVTTLKLD